MCNVCVCVDVSQPKQGADGKKNMYVCLSACAQVKVMAALLSDSHATFRHVCVCQSVLKQTGVGQ